MNLENNNRYLAIAYVENGGTLGNESSNYIYPIVTNVITLRDSFNLQVQQSDLPSGKKNETYLFTSDFSNHHINNIV